jgi:hypothetical protein
LETGPKWHEEEIRGWEDLLWGKGLVLEGAKKTISVVATENEVVITIERRCNITLQDFQNVHAVGF